MHTLIINQIDSLWANLPYPHKGISLHSFVEQIHTWAVHNCVDNVVVIRGEGLCVEGLAPLLDEFEFIVYAYGDYNYEDLVNEGDTIIKHPIEEDKVIQVDSWMSGLAGRKISMFSILTHPPSYELTIALRDGVGCTINHLTSLCT